MIQPVTANHFSTIADRWKLLTQAVSMFQYDFFDIYMSLWQKVLPLNPGMFVYSYLFSSYCSYMKLWLLLFSMHWWVVKVKIGSFGHQAED